MKLRTLLFGAFVAVSLLPVGTLAYWQNRTAVENEIRAVNDQHRQIALNLTFALERYVEDVELGFRLAAGNLARGERVRGLENLLRGLNFRHVYIMDAEGRIRALQCALECPEGKRMPPEVLEAVKPAMARAAADASGIAISDVLVNPAGAPAIYLLRALPGGDIVLGELATDYIRKMQEVVSFGEQGHVAIVDRNGRVIAHPREDWVASMKDISAVSAVRRMMAGETGVEQFYSPAKQAEMVAGFSVVPKVGWGVMVPQPYSEVVKQAHRFAVVALAIAGAGLVAAIGVSWWLSGVLARPIRSVAEAAQRMAAGHPSSVVALGERFQADEIKDLTRSFNFMLRDIAAKNEELSVRTNEAVKANNAKSEFLATISHELRTPLNAMIGFAESLGLGIWKDDPEKERQALRHIANAGRHLDELVGNVLDFEAIEKGKINLDLKEVVPRELFDENLPIVQTLLEEKAIKLSISERCGQPVFVDPKRLRQILFNLVSNAVKYSPRGGQIDIECAEAGERRLRISVKDRGIGIPEMDQDRIFEPFIRLAPTDSISPGTGLGLSVCKKLVEAMSGQIGVESAVGAGSTFWIEFPFVPAVETAPANA